MRLLILLFASVLVSTYAGSITRNKRGYLSRTGLCPKPADNLQKRDVRLNYWGVAVIRESDNPNPACSESECDEDSHCDGNRKCCANYCGARVCTSAMRDPHPCTGFHCPSHQTCRVQLVKCVMPDCPDAEAVNRPTCIPKELLHTAHSETLGDYQPDTTAELLKYAAAAKAQSESLAYTQQQTPYAGQLMNDAMPAQEQTPSPNDQQAYAAPMGLSDMSTAPAEIPNVIQTPEDTSNFAAAPSQDALSFQGQPADMPQLDQPQVAALPQAQPADVPQLDQPQVVAQPPAQPADAPQLDLSQLLAQPAADAPQVEAPQVVAQLPAQ